MRVLLVEDSPTDALLTREAINDAGYSLTYADRLEQASANVTSEDFDIILLDLGLPDSQGLDTFLKLHRVAPTIPIVILSAKDDEQLALEAVTAGAQDYLVKSQILDGTLARSIRYSIERQRVQESLRTSENRLTEAVRLARLGFWSRDLQTDQTAWSDLLYEILGIDPANYDHSFESFLRIVHPDDVESTKETINQAIRTVNRFDHTYRVIVRGEPRFIHEIGCVYTDHAGQPYRISGTAQDVTETILAEQAIRLRERAIGAASQGIVISDHLDPDHPLVYVSAGFERMTGYQSAEVLGRNCRFLQGKETSADAVARIRAVIQAEESCTVEVLNYRKDGSSFWNELSLSPIRDDAGKVTHYVGVQTDITPRRILEEQVLRAQRAEAIGQLAGGVAHDFNNLLTVINGCSQLLLESTPANDAAHELLSEILRAGERSAALTQQLLAFSRQQVLAPRVVDLNALVTETGSLLSRIIGEDIRLTTELASDLGAIRADPGHLEQLLLNLAVNARDAMPTGGELIIRTANVELDESFASRHVDIVPGPHVRLTIADTGCGMSAETQQRIFEPFFTTKGAGEGTGLGLVIVFNIVQASCGVVDVNSDVGVGTSFDIFLPRLTELAKPPTTTADKHPPSVGTETILLVEDEDGVRNLAKFVLQRCGYTVLEASDGESGLEAAQQHASSIDLLITDIVLPGTGGRTVANQMRERFPDLKVLFMSGYTDDAVVRHGILTEQVEFLQKPFSVSGLSTKVREVLDRGTTQ